MILIRTESPYIEVGLKCFHYILCISCVCCNILSPLWVCHSWSISDFTHFWGSTWFQGLIFQNIAISSKIGLKGVQHPNMAQISIFIMLCLRRNSVMNVSECQVKGAWWCIYLSFFVFLFVSVSNNTTHQHQWSKDWWWSVWALSIWRFEGTQCLRQLQHYIKGL